MQYLSISVMFVPHRLRCICVSRDVPSVTQNMFLFLLHNYWVSVSHLNSPLMNIKQISLEVFPQKRGSTYRPMHFGNTYAASSHNGFSWFSVLCEFCYLRCAEIQKKCNYTFKYLFCLMVCIHLFSWCISINKCFLPRAAGLLHSVYHSETLICVLCA